MTQEHWKSPTNQHNWDLDTFKINQNKSTKLKEGFKLNAFQLIQKGILMGVFFEPVKSASIFKSKLVVRSFKRPSGIRSWLHKEGSRQTVLSMCWLDVLQCNPVYGSGVLTNWAHIQECSCFQVKPAAIILQHTYRKTHTSTHTYCLVHTCLGFYTVVQCNLKTPPF